MSTRIPLSSAPADRRARGFAGGVVAALLLAVPGPTPAQTAPAAAPAAAVAAAAPHEAGPPPAPAREVRFPAFEEQTLPNGLRVVVIAQHEQPLVSLRLVVRTGASFAPAEKPGLANATADLLTKGTTTRSSQQIADAIDFVGGSLSANGGIEWGNVEAAVTSDQLDLGFELLSDIVLHPSFPQDELDRWRQEELSGLRVRAKNPGYLAGNALRRRLYGEHPYARSGDGTAESLPGLTRDDVVAFHAQRYVAGEALLAVVGDVAPADAFARARRAFGGWPQGKPAEVPAVTPPQHHGHRILVIDKPDAVQTEIRLGQVAIAFRDPDLYVAEVYDNLAGGNASSRLYEEVRGKRGLTYGIQSGFVEPTRPGWFSVSTSTKTATTVEALTATLDVLRGLGKEPVPAPELAAAETYVTGAFPLEIETASGTADKVLQALRFGYDRDFLEHYNARIAAVTAADVQRFARERMHPDDMDIVLVGNAAAFAAELGQKLGAFETIPASELDLLRPDLRKAAAAPAPPPAGSPQ